MTDVLREFQPMIERLEEKDLYTQGHSHHVFVVTKAIYDCLPQRWRTELDEYDLMAAALLHDIGKVQIPDSILKKEGKLTAEEYEVMKRHPEYGSDMLRKLGYERIADLVLYHHEYSNGKGYYGLKDSRIPLASKVIAVADTFSALRTYRIYRDAVCLEDTIKIINEGRGSQFDDGIAGAFLALGWPALSTLECNCVICRQRRAEMARAEKERGTALPTAGR